MVGELKKIKEQLAELCCETLPPLSSSKVPEKFNTQNAECVCLSLKEYDKGGRITTPLIRFFSWKTHLRRPERDCLSYWL